MAGGIVDAGNARDAARRDSWAAAYGGLRALDAAQMAPPDLEALADTAWWLSRRTSRSPPAAGLRRLRGRRGEPAGGLLAVTSQPRRAYLP